MEIVIKKIAELKKADYNPREISEFEMAELVGSIKEFGIVEPAIVNSFEGRENVIIGGHQRIDACSKLGMLDVPCFIVKLDPVKEKILNLALNKIQGRWDETKLADLIHHLKTESNIEKINGFLEEEVDQYLMRKQINLEVNQEYDPDDDEELKKLFDRNERVPVSVEEPDAKKNQQRMSFYTENFDEYKLIIEFFKTTRKGELDTNKLTERAK